MKYIRFEDRVETWTVNKLLTDLCQPNVPKNVYVDSPGGSFGCFSTLGPAIERQGVTTLAGNVASSAIILFLLGQKRQALADSVFIFHEIRALVSPGAGVTLAELEEVKEYEEKVRSEGREIYEHWLSNMRAAQSWYLNYVASRTGIPGAVVLNLMRKEAHLSAREAKMYGIVHEVVADSTVNF